MILPPLPETHLNNKVDKFYTAADMHFYGELCVKAVWVGGFEMNLPPLNSHDHPDFPSMKWTQAEMDAINAHVLACIAAYKASVSKRQSHRKYLDDKVAEVRDYAAKGMNYKQVNKLVPMSEVTFINIIKRRGAYK